MLKTQEESLTKFVELIYLNTEVMYSKAHERQEETFILISTYLPGKRKSILFFASRKSYPQAYSARGGS